MASNVETERESRSSGHRSDRGNERPRSSSVKRAVEKLEQPRHQRHKTGDPSASGSTGSGTPRRSGATGRPPAPPATVIQHDFDGNRTDTPFSSAPASREESPSVAEDHRESPEVQSMVKIVERRLAADMENSISGLESRMQNTFIQTFSEAAQRNDRRQSAAESRISKLEEQMHQMQQTQRAYFDKINACSTRIGEMEMAPPLAATLESKGFRRPVVPSCLDISSHGRHLLAKSDVQEFLDDLLKETAPGNTEFHFSDGRPRYDLRGDTLSAFKCYMHGSPDIGRGLVDSAIGKVKIDGAWKPLFVPKPVFGTAVRPEGRVQIYLNKDQNGAMRKAGGDARHFPKILRAHYPEYKDGIAGRKLWIQKDDGTVFHDQEPVVRFQVSPGRAPSVLEFNEVQTADMRLDIERLPLCPLPRAKGAKVAYLKPLMHRGRRGPREPGFYNGTRVQHFITSSRGGVGRRIS